MMANSSTEAVDYGNWVPKRLVIISGIIGLVFVILALFLPLLFVLAAFFLLSAVYFAYAYYMFSFSGTDIMAKVRQQLIDHLAGWDGTGKVLDIGCGNGALTIEIAKKYPQAHVMGIDYWGEAWEYSKGVCERNAQIEGVAGSVTFERASASSLPYEDGAYDVVVSNLVFHEVKDVRDKSLLIKEALRVVKAGGWFVFQDLFLWKAVYGDTNALVESIKRWGIDTVDLEDTSKSDFIPWLLKLPFMLGTVGVLYGKK